jgi:ribosome maturation protein Sdo1
MKTIIYCIYYAGVIVWGLCLNYLDAVPAIITTLVAPIILLQIAEMTGRIRIASAPKPTTPIELAMYHDMSDEEAINKFGWAMITEMDSCIEDTKTQLETMQKSREEMVAMYKKETK